MSCVRSLLCLFVSASLLQAHSTVIVQGGTAWYVPDGSSIAVQADQLIRLAGGGPVDPPIDPPPNPNPTELEQLSSQWKTKVVIYDKRQAHRQGMMAMHSVLAEQVDAGKFSDIDQLEESTVILRDLILGGDKSKWAEWYGPIGVYLGANVLSLDEAAPANRSIAAGLEVGNEAIDPGWIRLIEIIIEALGEGTIPPIMLALIKVLLEILGG